MTTTNMTLEQVFAANRGNKFVFVRPGGNWGDHLIYWGAECLANRLGLKWTTVRVEDFDATQLGDGTCIYVHGCGGMNPWCSGRNALALMRALESNAPLVIQGPSTYDNTEDYSRSFFSHLQGNAIGKDVIIFARELQTLQILRSFAPTQFSIGLDDDTAFHVRRSDFIQRATVDGGRYHLSAFRRDKEAAGQRMPRHGIHLDPASFADSFEHWLRIHAAAKSIRTDRLHSSVAGAILGIPTTLYGGSYHKNRSVWEKSSKDRGVLWGDFDSSEPSAIGGCVDRMADVFNKSWKINQLRLWYYEVPRS